MMSADGYEVETVRGGLAGERAEAVMAFWTKERALGEAEAARRLPQVVCVLRDPDGAIAGVNSAYPGAVELLGGRQFWVYRSRFREGVPAEARDNMVAAAYDALGEGFDPAAGGPLGLCLLIADRDEMARRPEAEWRDPRILYAGYQADGAQVRVGYFDGAKVHPGVEGASGGMAELDPELPAGYSITPFAETEEVGARDILDLWAREGAVPAAEAQRRVGEVLLVARDGDGRLAGLSSAYLQHNEQLGMDLWYYRAFVAAAHRRGNLAVQLALQGRDHLERQWVDGVDRRGAGLVYEVENEGLKRYFNDAVWFPTDVIFIGENPRGDHVRVRFHPGARAPVPGDAA
jgi:hypothetical protein